MLSVFGRDGSCCITNGIGLGIYRFGLNAGIKPANSLTARCFCVHPTDNLKVSDEGSESSIVRGCRIAYKMDNLYSILTSKSSRIPYSFCFSYWKKPPGLQKPISPDFRHCSSVRSTSVNSPLFWTI